MTSRKSATQTLILGIESSCDETAAAVVRGGWDVLSNIVATQFDLHEQYGGVVPEIASRAHLERILPVVDRAVTDAGLASPAELDAIAVGHRPGLIGSLIVGVSAAKALAWSLDRPLIGVDHIVAHLHAGSLQSPLLPTYPALGLVVSGGHTSLFFLRSPTDVRLLGRTRDDAIGEAFDKAAAMLGLGYPGGPRLDRRARDGDESAFDFPVARLEPDSLDFSFSGLKTALLYTVRGRPVGRGRSARFTGDHRDWSDAQINDLCASFQRAAIKAIIIKLERAMQQLNHDELTCPCTLIVGGGVSANSRLRAQVAELAERHNIELRLPKPAYCLDNAAMIAGLACHQYARGDVAQLDLSPSAAGTF